jgi:preprotein translocase subunit YajC
VWRLLIAQAQVFAQEGGGGGESSSGSPFASMLPMIIAFFAIMYFLMIRPQQKRERERREMLTALSKGDNVVTTGGICGSVVGLSEDRIVLRVDENVTMEFVRGAVAQVLPKETKGK